MLLHREAEHATGAFPAVGTGQAAEWLPARLVLVCEPSVETLFGVAETDAASFLRPFSIAQAVREHRALRRRLRAWGAAVLDVRTVLSRGDQETLRDAARKALAYEFEGNMTEGDRAEAAKHLERTLQLLDPETLANIVMLRPTAHLAPNPTCLGPSSRLRATFEVRPLSDACFIRDPLLITAAGAVIGRPRLDVRRAEADLAEILLRQLGIEPILRVSEPGHVEGGDLLPAGGSALMGQGPASDEDGIGQLLDSGAFGDVEVGIVRHERGSSPPSRLDESLTLFGPTLAGVCEDRIGSGQPEVDVYRPEPTMSGRRYRRIRTTGILGYLREKGFHILTFTVGERAAFASRGLLLGPMHYLAPTSAGDAFVSRLRDHGVVVETLPFDALGAGAGGPRSSTQVLYRAPDPRKR